MSDTIITNFKQCPCCKISKLLDSYYTNKKAKYGVQTYCKECAKAIKNDWRKNNPEINKKQSRKDKLYQLYKITIDEYDRLLLIQNNACAICKLSSKCFSERLSVDHNHKTGTIRGLLCSNCNQAIGKFKDSVELLKMAIEYLEIK